MGEIVLSREDVDRALDRLSADSDRIAASLVEMDTHPGHQLLRSATLTGPTKRRWAEASAAMATLWEQFATYKAKHDHAREVRARRARPGDDELAELTEILNGPIVELDSEHVPIERRGLTGSAQVTERITLDELLARMRASFDMVTAVLAAAESAWSAAIGQLDPLDTRLRDVSILAESVAAGDKDVSATVNGLRRGVDRARELVLTDVLTVSANDPLPGLARQLAELETRLAKVAEVRDSFTARLAALETKLSDIEAVEATARQTYTAVLEKIASPGLPEPTSAGSSGLRERLRRLSEKTDSGRWTELAAEADAMAAATESTLTAARRALGAITGLLDRRAELRGRLEAYQVKAARLGYAEDMDLDKLHEAAQSLLFTAPCDLPAATRALNRYLEAIQARAEEERS